MKGWREVKGQTAPAATLMAEVIYACPTHGRVTSWVQIQTERYCAQCFVAMLDKLGVCKVTVDA